MEQLSFVLTKAGFRLDGSDYGISSEPGQWAERFREKPYETLYALAFQKRPACFDAAGSFLCRVAERFSADLAVVPGLELSREKTEIAPSEDSLSRLLCAVPFVLGSECVTEPWLKRQYRRLRDVFRHEIAAYSGTVALYFAEKSQKLHVPERIFFHLVESKDVEAPFAFLATYATKTETGKIRHVPLQYALTEYREDRAKLLELLSCLNRASDASALIASFVESGELFHPLRLTAEEAYQLLRDIPALEAAGILCRIPNWWRKRSNAVTLTVKLGEERPAMLGLSSLLSIAPSLTVDGIPLTEAEIEQLLRQTEGLALLKGKWVEVDHGRLRELLALMKRQQGDVTLLEALRKRNPGAKALLIVPASLLGNWQKEAQRFVPEMSLNILHGASAAALRDRFIASDAFLTVTTYRMVLSLEALRERNWDCVILDEAQAVKNPAAKQTREIKKLHSRMRIAMTGTPIENDLTNLWSLFDFLDKGLLGSSEEFRGFCRGLEERPEGYARLRNMISPFLLRRVKTDKKIISDLPEKLEQTDYVELSAKQAVLYRKLLTQTQDRLLNSEGIARKGLVLALLLHLKQICNHPDQYLGQQEYDPAQSGKFEMLRQIAETIYEKRERVLVFTQFRELTGALDDYLSSVFHCRGGVIHGGVSAKGRTELVERFQSEDYMPYLVLSVKAGGTGLNLTNANHVIHFDRWWNPSVENQATDRAFRIGQQKNVMVHKFVCRGSVEEKIDALIASKRELAENVIGSGGEHWITELSNEELLSVLRLDP